MTQNNALSEAGRQYAAAYAAHYSRQNLREALQLYKGVITTHPSTPEAAYSHSQIHNIASSVVPREKLLAAQIELLRTHFEHEAPMQRGAIPS